MELAWKAAAATLLVATTGAAAAHDTWFEPLPPTPGGHVVFALGTGTHFPTYEFALAYESIAASGCRGEGAIAAPLAHVEDRLAALVVRSATAVDLRAGLTCWAQLVAFEVEVPPDKVEVYLREIQAGPALRATWAAMKARGLPWRERYTKLPASSSRYGPALRRCRWPWMCAWTTRDSRSAPVTSSGSRCCATASRSPACRSNCAANRARWASGARPTPTAAYR